MPKSSFRSLCFCFLLCLLPVFTGCADTSETSAPVPTLPAATEAPSQGASTPLPTPSPSLTPTPSPSPSPTPSPTPSPKEVSITFSFAGDVTLGSDLINQNTARNFYTVYDRVQDDAYFFANVLPIFEDDDITLVNLEGVLSDRGERRDKTFAFRGPSSYVNILLKGSVEAVSLGNNHSSDYGDISYEDTVAVLDEAGILHARDADVCYTTVKDTKIAMISIYELRLGEEATKKMLDSAIAEAKSEGALLIIASFHWGTEGSNKVIKTQTELAHYAIDLGANIVIGHHPHRLQGIEKYNGAYIVYSLANFCFGGNTNPADKDTMIFRQTFTLIDDVLQPDDNIQVIPCSVSSVETPNNYQPTPKTGEEGERIIGRINEFSREFGFQLEASSDGIYVPKQ